jgi:hypothetical protein
MGSRGVKDSKRRCAGSQAPLGPLFSRTREIVIPAKAGIQTWRRDESTVGATILRHHWIPACAE